MAEEKRKNSFHFRTIGGINGMNLNKHLAFIFGEKSLTYEWSEEEKTFTFFMREELISADKKREELKKHFEEFYRVKIVGK